MFFRIYRKLLLGQLSTISEVTALSGNEMHFNIMRAGEIEVNDLQYFCIFKENI